jgi:hypothetical protein
MILDAKQLNEGLDLKAIRVEEVRKVWNSLFTIPAPSEFQIKTWMCHSPFTIALGLREAARAFSRLQSTEHVIRYASKCMNTRTRILEIMKEKEQQPCPQSTTTHDSRNKR